MNRTPTPPDESLLNKYIKNPLLAGVIAMFGPVGATGNQWAQNRLAKRDLQKRAVYLDELNKLKTELTPKVLEEDSQIDALMMMLRLIHRANHNEKIRRFARLHHKYTRQFVNGFEEFEELANILDQLTPREFKALSLLRKFEIDHSQPDEVSGVARLNFFVRFQSYLPKYYTNAAEILDMEVDAITSLLQGTSRTGLFVTRSGLDLDGRQGHTTVLFDRLLEVLGEQPGEE